MADFDEEWEEWDGKSPFWIHCVAGSFAGVAEHTLVYPLDTVRTHIQVCAACHINPASGTAQKSAALGGSVLQRASTSSVSQLGMWQTMRHLMSQPVMTTAAVGAAQLDAPQVLGFTRLWRGVQTILIGCIPAHALYFSSYEIVKNATLDADGNVTTAGSALAGAAAVLSHDIILAPLDTVKQRLQLGHYRGLAHAMQMMIQSEGWVSLFRSFPITLASNIPYGMVMVGTNEFLKQRWTAEGEPLTMSVTLGASAVAGLTASATTTPLDRIKTYLQTQQLSPACAVSTASVPENCPLKSTTGRAVVVANWQQAATRIYQREGMIGFFRGLTPRILSHTPAVAISWTTYEWAKKYLQSLEW